MKARSYIRVSTEEQAREGFSLKAQEDYCLQFINSQGWEFDGSYKDDGYSAKNLDRPSMKQLIDEVKEFDVLVVYRLDRLVRSVADLQHLIQLFDKHNVKFKSVTEAFDTTNAMGRFFISLVGSMAQWERENLAERTRMGLERRFLEGHDMGRAPYGYKKENGRFVVDPDEAPYLLRIFEMYQDVGIRKIREVFNREGVPPRSGTLWHDNHIHYILKNEAYTGKLRYGQHTREADLPRLISDELWSKTQKMIERRKVKKKSATHSVYPFSGVLVCGRCGANLIGGYSNQRNSSKIYRFYKCSGRANYANCDMPRTVEPKIERLFFSSLNWFAEDIKMPQAQGEIKPDEKSIRTELERIKKRRWKWQEAFAADAITLEELKERSEIDRQREAELKQQLEAQPEQPSITPEEFREAIKDLESVWSVATARERKEIIQTLFAEIVIDREGNEPNSPLKIVSYQIS